MLVPGYTVLGDVKQRGLPCLCALYTAVQNPPTRELEVTIPCVGAHWGKLRKKKQGSQFAISQVV